MNKLLKFICLTAIAILALTNPNSQKYQSYASGRLSDFLKKDGCTKISSQVSNKLKSPCGIFIDMAKPQLKSMISQSTERKNFLIFSIYETQFSATPLTHSYYFATVGVLDRFFVYQTEIEQ